VDEFVVSIPIKHMGFDEVPTWSVEVEEPGW
jgi:hypothetical protein